MKSKERQKVEILCTKGCFTVSSART